MIEIIITSSVFIFALILIRKLCWGKISRRLQYGLWLLVAVRLLIPAPLFTSSLSIMNLVNDAEEAFLSQWITEHNGENASQLQTPPINDEKSPVNSENPQTEIQNAEITNDINNADNMQPAGTNNGGYDANHGSGDDFIHTSGIMQAANRNSANALSADQNPVSMYARNILVGIYFAGVILTGGCIVFCNLKFRKHLISDRKLIGKEGHVDIYLSDYVASPCLFGIGKPAVYMTANALTSEERKNYILLHEMTHYKHLDHVWAVVRSLCLTLYWFHPLVWLSAKLSMEDSELACDEGTFVHLGEENREAYGRTLISMMAEQSKNNRLLYCATGMINGKKEIKKRITAIAFYKKQMIWIAALVIVLAVFLVACTSGTREEKNSEEINTSETTGEEHSDDDQSNDENPGNKTTDNNQSGDEASDKEYSGDEDSDNEDSRDESNAQGSDIHNSNETKQPKLAEDVNLQPDGRFRMAEFTDDLTGDGVKDRIVFDVMIYAFLGAGNGETITEEMLWEKLWHGSDITVKVLEGKKENSKSDNTQNAKGQNIGSETAAEEIVLAEYSFSEAHAGNGNLAMVVHEGQRCLMEYYNLVYPGDSGFGYKIWQIMPAGQQPVLVKEDHVNYASPFSDENMKETIDKAISIGETIENYLSNYSSKILVNATMDPERCYMYGSEEGLINGVRRQSVHEMFFAELGVTGLNLKISDYFYPNGMEPITTLPDDAEERILNGEIMYMEVSPDNNTAGRLDLDGDGVKEVIYLEVLSDSPYDNGWKSWENGDEIKRVIYRSNYRVRVNDQYYLESYFDNIDPLLMAFSPDGKEILLATFDHGPSGDPKTNFYHYDETGVHKAGAIYDDLRNATIKDGIITCTFRVSMFQLEFAWGHYYWNGTEIVRREDELFYLVNGDRWDIEYHMLLMLLQEITVYEERSEDSKAIILKPQEVRHVATDLIGWCLLEGRDGTKGWIRVEPFGKFPSENADMWDLFEGLNMAD